MPVLFDTTVLIDYLRAAPGAHRVDDLLDRGEAACTSAVNVEEIVRGLHPNERTAAARLIEGLVVVKIGEEEGWTAGLWRQQFSARGETLSQADCLIAAAALTAGAVVATGNPKDFPMSEVGVEHWPVGRQSAL